MADFSALIASIRAQIRANGRQLITGPVMQASLLEIIDAVNAAKQDTLTFDSEPTEGSENPVTSGGVWGVTAALSDSLDSLSTGVQEGYDDLLGRIEGKQDTLSFDSEPTEGSANPVTSGGLWDIFDAFDGRINTLNADVAELEETAYVKPVDGIPFEDLTHSVQVSLEKAENALQPDMAYDGQIPVYNEDGHIEGSGITPDDVNAKADQDGTYPGLTAGTVLADAIPAEYLYRPCPAPMDGKAVLDTIKGNTIVSSGQLINNAAEGIKTVGRNQWDEVTEIGGIYTSNGANNNSVTDRIRAKNYCTCFGGKTYYYRNPTAVGMPIFWYDQYKSLISYTSVAAGGGTVTAPSNAAFFRISFQASYGTTYNNDICINLSDTAFNGQYEPYKESEVSLGLNSFRVTDGTNTITVNGLKSAGSVYDEIKDGKYIERVYTRAYQSGDESDATVITDGTNTNAPLATPIEYDIVSEIPNSYQVYEGGTEEILSDAIVAPFCASIRYPASPEGLTIVDMLTALKAAGVISDFAVTVDAATSKKTLTITA